MTLVQVVLLLLSAALLLGPTGLFGRRPATAKRPCCPKLREQIAIGAQTDHPDAVVITTHQGRGFGLPIRDGGNSFYVARYCPFCGRKLAEWAC
jgi:hypothetical protein